MKKTMVVAAGMAMALGCAPLAMQAQSAAAIPAAPLARSEAQAAPDVEKNPFPPVDPKNFTAASPTADEVNAFLKELWGYDHNRIWSVAAIEKTTAPGVAKVVVFVADKQQPGRAQSAVFFTTPDGEHAISGTDVVSFGPHPFAANRALLQQTANGPSEGAKSNGLELVEFAGLQCESCKEAQATMDQLQMDFPEAKIVFETFPMHGDNPYELQADAEGVCIDQEKGDGAFFLYTRALYATQDELTAAGHDGALEAAAIKAGADPKVAAACAATPAAQDIVAANRKLGEEVGVTHTPTLVVNGQALPIAQLPYQAIKNIVAYRAEQDGIKVRLQPTLSTLQ